MALRVGLTGALACGKSTVARMFEERGAYVMYADKVGHDLMRVGEPAYISIVEAFGKSILRQDETIDRARLADAAFGAGRIEELNRIIHPAVEARMEAWAAETAAENPFGILVFEAALILEAGMGKYFDKLIVVTCTKQQKLDRFVERSAAFGSADRDRLIVEAQRRMTAQLSEEEKIAAADYVIDNSGTRAETERQVSKIFKELQVAARQTA